MGDKVGEETRCAKFGVTAEALRGNIDRKIGVFEAGWSVSAKFSRSRGRPPRTVLLVRKLK